MGTLEWNPEDDGWVATVRLEPHPFRILIGGDERPDEHLLANARAIFSAPEKFVGRVNDLLTKEAHDFPDWTDEIRTLHVDDVSMLWPDAPDEGTIYFAGDTGERRWQCDLKEGHPDGSLSYDD